jgi:hypothetical protein
VLTQEFFKHCKASVCKAVCLAVDKMVSVNRGNAPWLAEKWDGLFFIKGLQSAADAKSLLILARVV